MGIYPLRSAYLVGVEGTERHLVPQSASLPRKLKKKSMIVVVSVVQIIRDSQIRVDFLFPPLSGTRLCFGFSDDTKIPDFRVPIVSFP